MENLLFFLNSVILAFHFSLLTFHFLLPTSLSHPKEHRMKFLGLDLATQSLTAILIDTDAVGFKHRIQLPFPSRRNRAQPLPVSQARSPDPPALVPDRVPQASPCRPRPAQGSRSERRAP